jgi:phosphoglucomutase
VDGIVRAHWAEYGRDYYSRHDYEDLDSAVANALMQDLRDRLPDLPGQRFGDLEVESGDDFSYADPVDGSVTDAQGIRIYFKGGARVVFRLSGTGTSGATLRVYLESYERDPQRHSEDPQQQLQPVIAAADAIAGITARTGRPAPSVVT